MPYALLADGRLMILFFPGHCLRERLLALVALDVGNTFLDASPNTSFLASANFLYISRARFADLGDPRQPFLTRVGKFCDVCFNAVNNAALSGLNSSTFRLDVGRTDSNLCHRDRRGKKYYGTNCNDILHHRSFSRKKDANVLTEDTRSA
jgi:hypothetical protein